jgi:16S rRNA (cytidine1402-2'-O)-methyltransferase
MAVSIEPGTLYVVATPIGNLGDLSPRAREVLETVDLVAAEDTRVTGQLLARIGLHRPLISLHEHNERARVADLVERLASGRSVALVSDAGTPLISDPGYPLVRECRCRGIRVSPVPGPSALAAALSVSGLPTDRFRFEGFLPRTAAARRALLDGLAKAPGTLVFFESAHRIGPALGDMAAAFGGGREAVVARELTKRFETILSGSLADLAGRVDGDPEQRLGEFVVLVAGAPAEATGIGPEAERVLGILAADLPVKQAATLAARILGLRKADLYRRILELKGGAEAPPE